MQLSIRHLATALGAFLIATPSIAEGWMPEQLYLNAATKHYGLDHLAGRDGFSQTNPGLGLAWGLGESNWNASFGVLYDSFEDWAVTGGFSYTVWQPNDDIQLFAGLSASASLEGDQYVTGHDGKPMLIKARRYASPYLHMDFHNFFVQWRPGINRYREPAGVFSLGLVFDLK